MKLKPILWAKNLIIVINTCFFLLSTVFLGNIFWGSFAEKLSMSSVIGLIGDTWVVLLEIVMVVLVLQIIFRRRADLKKSIWVSVGVLLYPTIFLCVALFMTHTSSNSLRKVRNNVRGFVPLRILYDNMENESVTNPIVVSRFTVFVENADRNKVIDVFKKMEQFVTDLESYYKIKLIAPINVIVTDDPPFNPKSTGGGHFGRNVMIIPQQNIFLEKGLHAIKHEVVHAFNEIYATRHQIEFPRFIDELVAQRLRVLKGKDTPCILPNNYQSEVDPYVYKRMLPVIYESLGKYYNDEELLEFPKDNKTSSMRYNFLILVNCNLNVSLERYFDWVKRANKMDVGEAFKQTFGIEFKNFVENPENVGKQASKIWSENKFKELENGK